MNSDIQAEGSSPVIEAIFPDPLATLAELEDRYPRRDLPEGAMVTRVGPSPTGFMHIGTLYVGLLSERFAHQTGGACFIRIEDTDKKREIEGAADFIFRAFEHFDVAFDEGCGSDAATSGRYGPYTQSRRSAIYHSGVKHLLEQGLAYPCFCTAEELEGVRARQQARGARPGYYGEWALWRDRSAADVTEALSRGTPYVIRFKSGGDIERKVRVEDLIYGDRLVAENDQDIVIMKSDRLPTYHLAHILDDHLMRTTHVIRGDEWLPSLPTHVQLFDAFGWTPPAYAHIAPINKMDGSSKRKLSKRKDPEASVSYFVDLGYPAGALIEYLLNLANSNFEDWRKAHPLADYREFTVSFEKLGNSNGPLFDFVKLDSISRDVVARLSTADLSAGLIAWAKIHDPTFIALLETDPEYTMRILDIERDGPKVRKDLAKWSDVRPEIECFFDSEFRQTRAAENPLIENLADVVPPIVKAFMETYNPDDDREVWFDKIKAIARDNGFAEKAGDFKRNPEAFRGTVADVAKVFRVILTGRAQTPDLHSVMRAMGQERVFARLSDAL